MSRAWTVAPGGRADVRHAEVNARARGSGGVAHGFKFLCGGGQGGLDRGDLAEPALVLGLLEPVGEVGANLLQARLLSWVDPQERAPDTGIRCSMLRPDPAARGRLTEIIKNLADRISEARINGWLGEVEGLQVSLTAARAKLAALDRTARNTAPGTTDLGMPAVRPAGQETP